MAPLVKELESRAEIQSICCITAQHRQMLDDVLQLFAIQPDYDLDIMEARQSLYTITSKCLLGMEEVFSREKPDLVLVHGDTSTTFSGALAWPFFYPWPPHNQPLLDEAFAELARRWRPLLDLFDEQGVDVCYEIHPGEDLHDGVTFERFLTLVDNHPRCNMLYDPSHLHLQQMDYLTYIDIYHARIKAFHVKDAEFRRNGRNGVYGGYQPWQQRAGRFRSPGDGQIDFKGVFSKLTEYDFAGWAVLEWECCLKDSETGAREGSEFIRRHIIPVAGRAFDDFAAGGRE